MKTKPVEIPSWIAAVWLFGPYTFAALVITFVSTSVTNDLAITLFLILEQTLAIYWSPKLNSVGGGITCSFAIMSFLLLWKGMTCGSIRSMMTMELLMNGGFRYVHLLSDEHLRRRSFTHRLAFVTIFSDVVGSQYVDAAAAWQEFKTTLRGVVLALLVAVFSWSALAYGDFGSSYVASWSTSLDTSLGTPLGASPGTSLGMSLGTLLGTLIVVVLRVGLGAWLIYSLLTVVDGVYRSSLLLVRPLGISCEAAMDEPYYATSFSNFWGKRWDRPMQTILYSGAFQPMRKGCGSVGVGGAVFVTFIVSGVVHTLGVAACGWVSAQSCVSMMCFFLLQAVFVLVEGVLKRPAGMYLTQTLTWITSPLFVLPFLELMKL